MRYNKEPDEGSRVSFRNVMCIRRRQRAGKSYCGVTLLLDEGGVVEFTLAKGPHDGGQQTLHPLELYPDVCRERYSW
jgi:hypothetical protein